MPEITIKQVRPVAGRTVTIDWSDGVSGKYDLTAPLYNRRSLVALRNNDQLFRQVSIGEAGLSLCWPDDLSLSASSIISTPNTQMTASEFIRISEDAGLSVEGLSQLLGISRRQIANYRSAVITIPPYLALSMRYLERMRTVVG
jgi:hypothetical protein